MSDVETADRAEYTGERSHTAALTSVQIEWILNDFREWLEAASTADLTPPDAPQVTPIDAQSILAQFTALRHEVNLQTKATRIATDQTAKLIEALPPPPSGEPDREHMRPIIKTLLDIHDSLSVARRQVEKTAESVEIFGDMPDPLEYVEQPPAGWFQRKFGRPAVEANITEAFSAWVESSTGIDQKRSELLASAADGYSMSQRRIERALPQLGLEPIECIGEPFDPEKMEVVDTVADADQPDGTVVEEVRRGYLWNRKLFRFAQVKVSKS